MSNTEILKIKKFEDLKVSVMSLYITLDGKINIDNLYPSIPIHILKLDNIKKKNKKFKIPFSGVSGSILSVQYKGDTRGIIKKINIDNTFFKHSLSMDISNSYKNYNARIFEGKFLICGLKSEEEGIKSANILINKIYSINNIIKLIKTETDVANNTLAWIKKNTKSKYLYLEGYSDGECLIKFYTKNILYDDKIKTNIDIYGETSDSESVDIDFTNIDLDTWANEEKINLDLLKYLLSFSLEFYFYEDYCKHLDWLFVNDYISGELTITKITKSMVNYNYDLGFPINRIKFAAELNKHPCYDAQFFNSGDNYIKVKLPFNFQNGESAKNRLTKKIRCNKFLCYRPGKITQSGPGDDIMKPAYEDFIEKVRIFIHKIIKIDPLIHKINLSTNEEFINIINNMRNGKNYKEILQKIANNKDKEIIFPYSEYGINFPEYSGKFS